jgi:hypothetical protein
VKCPLVFGPVGLPAVAFWSGRLAGSVGQSLPLDGCGSGQMVSVSWLRFFARRVS